MDLFPSTARECPCTLHSNPVHPLQPLHIQSAKSIKKLWHYSQTAIKCTTVQKKWQAQMLMCWVCLNCYYCWSTHAAIAKFLSYRSTFPQATIIPKMHFLEDHTVPWIKKQRTGIGFLGEQGGESIHKALERLYNCIPTKWSDYITLWKPTIRKCAQNWKNVLRVLLGKRDYKKLSCTGYLNFMKHVNSPRLSESLTADCYS